MVKCPVCNQIELEYKLEKLDFAGNPITTPAPGDGILPATATDCQLWELYRQHGGNKETASQDKLAAWIASLGYTKQVKYW